MIAIVQRVEEASVTVEGQIVGKIGEGLLVLAAIEVADGGREIAWMAHKLAGLRVFRWERKHFDRDVREAGGSVLLVSNFTVAADTRKGRRPSLDGAAPPAEAEAKFASLVESVRATGVRVESGKFGSNMRVSLVNDGPATFVVRTNEKT